VEPFVDVGQAVVDVGQAVVDVGQAVAAEEVMIGAGSLTKRNFTRKAVGRSPRSWLSSSSPGRSRPPLAFLDQARCLDASGHRRLE